MRGVLGAGLYMYAPMFHRSLYKFSTSVLIIIADHNEEGDYPEDQRTEYTESKGADTNVWPTIRRR